MASERTEAWLLRRGPALALVIAFGTLLLSWLAVVAIDALDLFGMRGFAFVERESDYPYAFYHLFADNHPIEWAQWLLMLVAVVAVAVAAGIRRAGQVPAGGVLLLSLSLGVVVLQDAGNQRDVAANLALGFAGSTASTVVEGLTLGIVGLLAIYGLMAAWPVIAARSKVRNMWLAGYGAYALVGLMDLPSDYWYVTAGRWILEHLFGGQILDAPASWESGLRAWLVMDAVIEESVELIGAGLLAAAALLLLREAVALGTQGDLDPRSTVGV